MPTFAQIDRDGWLWRRGRVLLIALLLLLFLGLATRPWQSPIWRQVKATQPELNLQDVEGALGQGLIIGLIGGFRTIIADFLFIRANLFWEKKDRPNTEAMLNLVVAVDPRPMFFWLNGARMLAYDMPAWEIKERGGFGQIPAGIERAIKEDYAELGVAFIDKAKSFHPDDYRVPLEKAQIYTNRLEDYAQAGQYYEEVIAMEGAPFYADRIYAEMLRRSGRPQAAYEHLTALYPTLPKDHISAAPDVVLERIRELEAEMDLPSMSRFPTQPEERIEGEFEMPNLENNALTP